MDFVIAAQPPPAWFWLLVVVATVVCLAVELLVLASLNWLVSKLVMPRTGTFRNAWRLLGYKFLLGLAGAAIYLAVNLLGFFFYFSKSGPSPQFIQIVVVLLWLMQIVFAFIIIMHVYEASFWQALGFEFVYFVIVAGLVIGGAILMINSIPAKAREDMKRAFVEASHGRRFTLPASAATPSAESSGTLPPTPRPAPAEVALVEAVQIPVMLGGKNAGSVTLQPGTRVKLISKEGGLLKVQYLDTVTTVPQKSTDYNPVKTP